MGNNIDEFNKLIKQAGELVIKQAGQWDHDTWLNFLTSVRRQGYYLTKEMQDNLGLILEATRELYFTVAMKSWQKFYSTDIHSMEREIAETITKTLERTSDFIRMTKGVPNQSMYESFIDEMRKNSISISEQTLSNLTKILKPGKTIYNKMTIK